MSQGSGDLPTSPRVLVADDEEMVRTLLGKVLRRQGYDVTLVADGDAAVAALDEGEYDVVVSDIQMPSYDGITLLNEIRRSNLDLPVILVTGEPTADTAIRALRHGALNYLSKPVSAKELVQEVSRAVRLYKIARLRRESEAELGLQPSIPDRAGLEVTFDRALEALYLLYQPVLCVSTRRVFGYEVLVRSSEEGMPTPGALLDAAERLGRLPDLGRRIRDLSVRPLADAPPDAALLVNLHTKDLLDEALYDPGSPLAAHADRVILEITERAQLDDVGDPRPRVARLRELGFRIAIDDIGAGYSGLTSFATLAPDLLKIDMSLVRNVHKSRLKQKLISSLVSLCRDLQTPLVAEGVETVAEHDALVELGCDLVQGFLYARPHPPFVTPEFP